MHTPEPPADADLPRRLNLKEFALRAGALRGRVPVSALPRLASSLHAEPGQLTELRAMWELQGMVRYDAADRAQPLLRLRVQAQLPMLCQRCLQRCWHAVEDTVVLRLVDEEPELDAEELESEEEAFCARHPVDLAELVEDQLILALPLVPMHDSCPQALPTRAGEAPAQASPFAVLAGLRKPN